MSQDQARFVLAVPGLTVSRPWDVGPVRFHPAETSAGLIEEARRDIAGPVPGWYAALVDERTAEFEVSAVAEVRALAIGEAIAVVDRALAILRVVQRLRYPMVDARRHAFGLPGQVRSARIVYVELSRSAALGWKHLGADTGWGFGDDDHEEWASEPAYRFLHEALACPEASRSPMHRRVLVAVGLISQALLTWEPDLALLDSVMALEALLCEPNDVAKKFRLARRVCYFICGWPASRYTSDRTPACPYLALPIRPNGHPGNALDGIIKGGRQQAYDNRVYCSQFFDVLDLYDDRSAVTHGGELRLGEGEEVQATWFIAAWLLLPVLRWFAAHPSAELSDLDAEVAALPTSAAGV